MKNTKLTYALAVDLCPDIAVLIEKHQVSYLLAVDLCPDMAVLIEKHQVSYLLAIDLCPDIAVLVEKQRVTDLLAIDCVVSRIAVQLLTCGLEVVWNRSLLTQPKLTQSKSKTFREKM